MHDAFQMREHRNARFMLHARDKAFAAARHDHVYVSVQARKHGAHGGAVVGRHERDDVARKAGALQSRDKAAMDRPRGAQAIRAAAQDRGVAGLEAQRAGVGGDIGPALVNHADNTQRRRDALDAQAIGPLEHGQHTAHGVGQIGDFLHAARHRLDALLVEGEPIHRRSERVGGLRLRHVQRVRGKDRRAGLADFRRRRAQRLVLDLGGRQRGHMRATPRRAADIGHEALRVRAIEK